MKKEKLLPDSKLPEISGTKTTEELKVKNDKLVVEQQKIKEYGLREDYISNLIYSQHFLAYATSKLEQVSAGKEGIKEFVDGRKKTVAEVYWELMILKQKQKLALKEFNSAKDELKKLFGYTPEKFKQLDVDAGVTGG